MLASDPLGSGASRPRPTGSLSPTILETLGLFEQVLTVAEIAAKRQLSPATIEGRLAEADSHAHPTEYVVIGRK